MSDDDARAAFAARQQKLFSAQEDQSRADLTRAAQEAARTAATDVHRAGETEAARLKQTGEAAHGRITEALSALQDAQRGLDDLRTTQEALTASERRLERLRRSVWLGAGIAALLLLCALLGGVWAGAWQIAEGRATATRIVTDARGEAEAIRAAGAEEIANIRTAMGQAIDEARQAAAERYDETVAALDEAGVQLAAVREERDAIRAELERFIELRDRVGFTMAQHFNGKPVIIVPEGKAIQAWGAPGLSELARYNGRMFAVVDER